VIPEGPVLEPHQFSTASMVVSPAFTTAMPGPH
jgi:hypothetical protein